MPVKDITPATPTYLIGLRASTSDQYFWISYTTDEPQDYVATCVERARASGENKCSPRLKEAILGVLAGGDTIEFDNFRQDVPHGEIEVLKLQAIGYFMEQGHPLRNSEVAKIKRMLALQQKSGAVEERQRARALQRAKKEQEKALYLWPAAPEGSRTIYAEEEWINGEEAPRVVRVGATKNSAGDCNRGIGASVLMHPYTEQAHRARDQKLRGVTRRLRLLEVHPRAGLKARKDAWALQLGLG